MSQDGKPTLLSPYTHAPSGLHLQNRVVMAPMTRGRSGPTRVPNDLNVEHYAARADAGLIITEGASFSQSAHGWAGSAGLETEAQVEGWKKVVEAVHAKGALISVQLWHMGRASHSSYRADKSLPIAPSAIAINGETYAADGSKVAYETPRAIETSEIPALVQTFKDAAVRAKEAGFDFVEIHNANGYLLDEFLQTTSNKRTDAYGGSVENRFRLIKEVVEAVLEVLPADRVGIRFSPNGMYNDVGSEDNIETFTYAFEQLAKYKLGWLHVLDGLAFGFHEKCRPYTLEDMRKVYAGPIIANCGYTKETADATISAGLADCVSFGRPFLSNPDLVDKFHTGAPQRDMLPMQYWYMGGAEGYTVLPEEEPKVEGK